MSRRAGFQLLAAGLLIGWCVLFLRGENTEKSIVRALLLEQTPSGWSAGLLYQFPEASADASETEAKIRFVLASGSTPQAALVQAEKKLPRKANYRLCDYLLLGPGSTLQTIQTCETLYQERPYGRLASRVFLLEVPAQELEMRAEAEESLPEMLLESVKADAAAPRLYENRNGCLLPVLAWEDDALSCREERLLVTATGETALTAEESDAALFLLGRKRNCRFETERDPVELTRLARSVEEKGEGFRLLLTCRCPPESRMPTQEELAAWETLCTETVRRCWAKGFDLLQLGSVRALRDPHDPLTTKNACPEIRTDVVLDAVFNGPSRREW